MADSNSNPVFCTSPPLFSSSSENNLTFTFSTSINPGDCKCRHRSRIFRGKRNTDSSRCRSERTTSLSSMESLASSLKTALSEFSVTENQPTEKETSESQQQNVELKSDTKPTHQEQAPAATNSDKKPTNHEQTPAAANSDTKPTHQEQTPAATNSSIILISRILKGIPHSPHFWSLRKTSYLTKINLIKAWDGIFEQTVEELQSLQLSGFWVNATRIWETLEDLQGMGYNVILLRRRLVELTDVFSEQHKLKTRLVYLDATWRDILEELVQTQVKVPFLDALFMDIVIRPLLPEVGGDGSQC